MGHVCDVRKRAYLGHFGISRAHSTRPVTHVTGGFTGLRPPVGTYDLRSYGGEHQKAEADRRLSPNWHFLCTELANTIPTTLFI